MNIEQLLDVIETAQGVEKRHKLLVRLKEVQQAFQKLVANPQDAATQTEWVSRLDGYSRALQNAAAELTPTDVKNLELLSGAQFFFPSVVDNIRQTSQVNAITPTITQQYLDKMVSEQEEFIQRLRQINTDLKQFGFSAQVVQPSEAEIGFLLPRTLFHNNLKELSRELGVIDKIVKFVGEAVGSKTRDVEVKSISTSDPLFFLSYDVQTIVAVGGLVTWCLHTLKQILEIQDLRNRLQSIGLQDKETEALEKRIGSIVDTNIEDKVCELISDNKSARANELRSGLDWALRSIMSRVERGMTVEIRFLPPPIQADGEAGTDEPGQDPAYTALAEVARGLQFPEVASAAPIVAIPSPTPPTDDRTATKDGAATRRSSPKEGKKG